MYNPSNNLIIAMKTSLLLAPWKKVKLGEEEAKKERPPLYIDPCLFCIDASAYLILDIALLPVLPDRTGRNAVSCRSAEHAENTAL